VRTVCTPALMCLEHVLYLPQRQEGGVVAVGVAVQDGASVGPNDVSDLYRLNGVNRHLFYLYNVLTQC